MQKAKVIPLEPGTTCPISGKIYPVTAVVEHPALGNVPLVDVPMMSDDRWRELVAQAKARHPEYYAQAVMA